MAGMSRLHLVHDSGPVFVLHRPDLRPDLNPFRQYIERGIVRHLAEPPRQVDRKGRKTLGKLAFDAADKTEAETVVAEIVGIDGRIETPEAMIVAVQRRRMQQVAVLRSEAHTSELQSPMRLSYAVLCLKKQT